MTLVADQVLVQGDKLDIDNSNTGKNYKYQCQEHQQQGDQDIIDWFEDVAENAALAQTETLRRILELNHGTEYLTRWLGEGLGVDGLRPEELEKLYTSAVPLSSHADVEPYIRRIADGDSGPVLTRQPITTLSLSSGTTDGRPKYVPFTRFSAQTTLEIFRLAAAYRSRVLPIRPGGRILELIYSSKQFKTMGGLTAGTATTHYFESEEFKIKQRDTKSFTCSPREVIAGGDYRQSTYCHLLLGLHHAEQVEFVTSTFAYSIVQAFQALEELWPELLDDIRSGEISSTRVTSPEMRRAVEDVIKGPNSDLAAKLEPKFRDLELHGWEAAVPVLWANAKYVYAIMTGSMLPYMKKLRHYAGGLPVVGAEYGSTESWIGVNLDPCCPPEKVTFAVIPTFSYFEFIPLYRQRGGGEMEGAVMDACDDFVEAEPVPLSRVKVGQEYEVVLTTFTGLYRYRLGDVVEVAGFYRGTPRLKFVCRRKLILSINIDKNTETDLQLVVEKGSRFLARTGAELADFTSHADTSTQPGHYVIYWEIHGAALQREVLEQCCREMDLAFTDHGYVVSRKTGSIGPLELRVVEKGTFKKILEYYIGNGSAVSQFKTPRCTGNRILLQILDRCTVQKIQSSAYL